METSQFNLCCQKNYNNNDENDVYAVFISVLFPFCRFTVVFYIYNLFKKFTFLLVVGEIEGDCFSLDRSQDVGECVSNSVAEATIMEIKDMYHPLWCFWLLLLTVAALLQAEYQM